MNDIVQQAAEVIQKEFGGFHALRDQSNNRTVDSCALARTLAATGLLADPTGTAEKAAVIEAVCDIRYLGDVYPEVARMVDAVDRLEAAIDKTQP